jgi:hypothetical protein
MLPKNNRNCSSMFRKLFLILPLCACLPAVDTPPAAPRKTSQCTSKMVTPAIIETVTQQIVVKPAQVDQAGNTLRPATYRTKTSQKIVRPRQTTEFAVLCASEQTPELITNLQRALAVRGVYNGPITGTYDAATSAAVRTYQAKDDGPDTPLLLRSTAQNLGLVIYTK